MNEYGSLQAVQQNGSYNDLLNQKLNTHPGVGPACPKVSLTEQLENLQRNFNEFAKHTNQRIEFLEQQVRTLQAVVG